MKRISLDLPFVLLLVAAAAWMQFHSSDLLILGAVGLIPLIGSVVATPKKSTKRQARVYANSFLE